MHASTGRQLPSDVAHIQQSIADIITTPVGTRVMRRDYGSVLPELIDQPLNEKTILRLYAATAIAIMRWEPRFSLTAVQLTISATNVTLQITGALYSAIHTPLTTDIILNRVNP